MKQPAQMRAVCASLLAGLMFAGSALAQDIAWVKADAMDGSNNTYFAHDIMHSIFTVTGRVTSPFMGFTTDTVIFIQDTSAGIRVESDPVFKLETNNTIFAPGVQVTVWGMIDQSNGMRMIRPVYYDGDPYDSGTDFYISDTTTSPVAPTVTVITNYLAQGEDFEGSLIRINGLTMGTNAWAYRANSSLTVTDSTGTITLFIDRNTDVDGQLPPTNTFDLIGLASQYSTLPIPSNGYGIMPRSYSDFIHTVGQEPPSIYILATNATAFVDAPFRLYIVGRDRNAGDTIVLTTNMAPAGASFTALGGREGRLDWTPGPVFLNTTNTVVFRVTDGLTTNTAGATIKVQPLSGGPGYAWINEFHYHDTSGTGTYEGVELAGSAGVDLSSYYLLFYSDQTLYFSNSCSGVIPDESLGYGAVWFAIPGLSNSAPGGIALMHQTRGLLQFLSYEGVMMATGGPAAGAMSVDVGIKEDPPPIIGFSLQLQGGGTNYEDFVWAGPIPATRGTLNTNGQYIPPHAIVVFTNLALNPLAPHPNQSFDIVCTITPNSTASNLAAAAWFRLSGGAWSNISMTDQGQFTNRTVTQVGAQTNGTLVEYYAAVSFIGPGTNSPMYSVTNSFMILNYPPAFSNLTDKSVTESNTLTFTVTAGDVDSDFITLTASNVPAGAAFYPTNGTGVARGSFVWTNAQPVGVYTTAFYAADADSISSTSITITVNSQQVFGSNDLVFYDFDLGTATFTNAVAYTAPQLGASVFTTDNGVFTNSSGNPASGKAISGRDWNVTNRFYTFTVTINNGYQLNPTALKFDDQRSGTGPTNWFVRYSGDNYATILGEGIAHTNILVNATNSVALSLLGLTNTVTFHIHCTNTGSAVGTWRLDNVLLQGAVTQIGGDADGIPVSWWDRYGIPSGERLATNNPDSDSANNYEEFVADTIPTNNASYFVYRVTNMTGFGTVQLLVGPPTTNSRLYDAWWITNLMNQAWTPYNYNVPGQSNGASFYLTVTNVGAGRFYRTGVKVP